MSSILSAGRFEASPDRNGHTSSVTVPSSGLASPDWKALCTRHAAEHQEDLKGLETRLHRLQLRIAGLRVAGMYRTACEDDAPPELSDWYVKGENERSQSAVLRKADALNRVLPSRFRIQVERLNPEYDGATLDGLRSSLLYRRPASEASQSRADELMERLVSLRREVRGLSFQGRLFAGEGAIGLGEEAMTEAWVSYRALLKDVAHLYGIDSYFTPTHGTSGRGERGPNQESAPFYTDYQRCGMEERKAVARQLHARHFRKTEYSEYGESVLFNNGLQAFSATLSLIEKLEAYRHEAPRPIFKTRDIYFEVDQLIEDFCEKRGNKLRVFEPSDTRALVTAVIRDRPSAIFLNPLSNMYDLPLCDVGTILDALETGEVRAAYQNKRRPDACGQVTVVIDNSVAGNLARWKDRRFESDRHGLSSHVQVISIESLIKYGQDGQDLTQGALATCVGNYLASELGRVVKHEGYAPPEHTVRTLDHVIERDQLDERLLRHSRNAALLATRLSESLGEPGLIAGVHHPGLATHPQHELARRALRGSGPFLTARFDFDALNRYREAGFSPFLAWEFHEWAKQVAKAFNNVALTLARECGVELNEGSGYGFNTTRIATYERLEKHGFQKERREYPYPYLRIAAGTEPIKQISLVGEVLARTNEIFGAAMKAQSLSELLAVARDGPLRFVPA